MLSPRGQMLLRLGQTCNLCLGCMGLGLILALTGVALLDLVEIYDSDIASVSHLITTRVVGGLLGSLVGGKLYDKYNVQIMTILMTVISCVAVLMIPLSGSLAVAYVMIFFGGLSSGAFDPGANVWIIRMWPENSNPALQVFHLAFGIGCVVAPLIADPFLSTGVGRDALNQTANLTDYPTFNDSNYSSFQQVLNETIADEHSRGESRVYYSFGIVSAFHLLLVISMVALYFIDSSDIKPSHAEEGGESKTEDVFFARALLALLSTYGCVYVALECTTSQMLTAYAVKSDLHFAKPMAARLAAVYFFCFAASRGAAALITVKMSAFQMLILAHVILVVAATLLLIWGCSSAPVLWACSALMGIGQAPIYAAVVSWAVSYMNFNNFMMSIVILMVGIGALSPPLFVGQFLDHTPNVFLYVCFASTLLCVAVFVAMYFYVRKRPLLNPKIGNASL